MGASGLAVLVLLLVVAVSVHGKQEESLERAPKPSGTRHDSRRGSRHHRPPGRHMCLQNSIVTKPVKHVEIYCKPVYKSQMYPCEKDSNKFCTSFRVVYERAHRTVYKITTQTEETYDCCAGWARTHPGAMGCNKPICSQSCKNGGTCTKPDFCVCPPGWTGKICSEDVDECKRETKCEQKCINSPGSYRCTCHEGFVLETDGRRCKINIYNIPEITDFIQNYEELSKKVQMLEKLQEEQNTTELAQRLDNLSNAVEQLRDQLASKVEETAQPPITPPSTTTTSMTGSSTENSEERYGSPWDRINSLSEQISMLEERLEDCG